VQKNKKWGCEGTGIKKESTRFPCTPKSLLKKEKGCGWQRILEWRGNEKEGGKLRGEGKKREYSTQIPRGRGNVS